MPCVESIECHHFGAALIKILLLFPFLINKGINFGRFLEILHLSLHWFITCPFSIPELHISDVFQAVKCPKSTIDKIANGLVFLINSCRIKLEE